MYPNDYPFDAWVISCMHYTGPSLIHMDVMMKSAQYVLVHNQKKRRGLFVQETVLEVHTYLSRLYNYNKPSGYLLLA